MLVSVEEFERYTEVKGDRLAASYIKAAEEIVSNYLGYNPEEKVYDGRYNGTGIKYLFLEAQNITEIQEVDIDGVSVDVVMFYAKENALLWTRGRFPCGERNVHVKYKAGWSSTSVPEVIKGTVLQIAALRQTESGQNIGVSSKSFGESGTRVFLSTRNYDSFLMNISRYKLI